MHWPKSSNMTKTCYHHMLFVGGVGFYSKITFLTPISRSKVICRSKSCDMLGQGQWSFSPSLVKIGQVMTELQRDWQKKERKKERILQRQNKTACLPSCKEERILQRQNKTACLPSCKKLMQYKTLPRCAGRVKKNLNRGDNFKMFQFVDSFSTLICLLSPYCYKLLWKNGMGIYFK